MAEELQNWLKAEHASLLPYKSDRGTSADKVLCDQVKGNSKTQAD